MWAARRTRVRDTLSLGGVFVGRAVLTVAGMAVLAYVLELAGCGCAHG
jgi:hypothetical protein